MGNYEPNQAIIQAALEMDKRSKELFIKEVYEKALEIQKQKRIKMEDFQDLYGQKDVEADLKKVAEEEAEHRLKETPEQKEAKKLSVIMEVMLVDQINARKWFGTYTKAFLGSAYDDLIGVDIIVEIANVENEASHLGIAVDVTYSKNVDKKISDFKKNIDIGNLSRVKYFKSENVTGPLINIPRLIIGADKKTIIELARLWDADKRGPLKRHPVQLLFLKQIEYQLLILIEHLKAMGKGRFVLEMEKRLELIQPLIQEKEEDFPDLDWKSDGVSDAIIKAIRQAKFSKNATA